MASNFYNIGLLRLLNGSTTFTTDSVKGLIVDNTYTFNVSHEYVSDVSGEVSGTGYARFTLTGKTVELSANTVRFDCANVLLDSVNTANALAGVVIFEDTGIDSTSAVLGFFDIPVTTTDGSNVTLVVSSNGLFEVTNNIS